MAEKNYTPSLESKKRLYIVQPSAGSNVKMLVWALDDGDARNQCIHFLSYNDQYKGGALNPDPADYVVTAITKPGDRVHMRVTLYT